MEHRKTTTLCYMVCLCKVKTKSFPGVAKGTISFDEMLAMRQPKRAAMSGNLEIWLCSYLNVHTINNRSTSYEVLNG